MNYCVRYASKPVCLDADWDSSEWAKADTLAVDVFREERGGDHRPVTQCKLLYDTRGMYGLFRVQDRYVRSLRTRFQEQVCRDSCVEFFVEPPVNNGYLNVEFNAGGTFLVYHIIDPTRTEQGSFKDRRALTLANVEGLRVFHSLPRIVEPEREEPTVWRLGFFIPFAVFERTTGLPPKIPGGIWRGNFYKCGDDTSHPHWASWKPLTTTNFHLPSCFGEIEFAAQ